MVNLPRKPEGNGSPIVIFLRAAATAKDVIFDLLRSASGNKMGDQEICEAYLSNNLHRPARKAFINQFPDRYQELREIK